MIGQPAQPPPPATPPATTTPLQQLAALVDRLGRPGRAMPPCQAPAAMLKTVARHQATWARLRAEQRLRQAGAKVPAQAGPLHSAQVVYRALLELHQISPAYLDALMAQVDTLMWLEQASGVTLPPADAAVSRPASPARPARRPAAAQRARAPR